MTHFEALGKFFLSNRFKVLRRFDMRAAKPFLFADISNFSIKLQCHFVKLLDADGLNQIFTIKYRCCFVGKCLAYRAYTTIWCIFYTSYKNVSREYDFRNFTSFCKKYLNMSIGILFKRAFSTCIGKENIWNHWKIEKNPVRRLPN